MKSHTVPRYLLDQFAYDEPVTRSRRFWQYAKGRPPWGFASPSSATCGHPFADPADPEREEKLEARLNQEFENPVHQFLGQLRYRTFVLSRLHVRQLTRYVTLLFNRSDNRRKATKEQVAIGIDSVRSLLAKEEQLAQIAGRWTIEIIRLGQPLQRPVSVDKVRETAEKMIATMQTEKHLQTTYVDAMDRAMAFLDEGLDNGQWNLMHTTPDAPFVIGDAPVITWQRLGNGTLLHGQGFATPNVEVLLPVASTACIHILPLVQRTRPVRQPTVKEVNEAQAAYATRYCYANINDSTLDAIIQLKLGQNKIGINVFSVRHRNYENTMFELLRTGGTDFRAARR
jgi:hypothetical protein